MNKKMATLTTVLVMSLLLIGMLTLTFNIQPVKASGTIYIRADGSVEPSTANITTADNVTYYFTDNNYDEVVVERSNIIVDGNGYTVQGSGSGYGFSWSGINNVTIQNTNIMNFSLGVSLSSSSSNAVSRNNITAGMYGSGISLSGSSNNTVSGNNVTAGMYGSGIGLGGSSNNIISGNNIISSAYRGTGISLSSSSNNDLTWNNVSGAALAIGYSSNNRLRNNRLDSTYCFGVWGGTLEDFINDVDESNTVNGRPVYYWINRTDATIPADAGFVALINCTNITVEGLNLTGNSQGIVLAYTKTSRVVRNTIRYNVDAVYCVYSSNNTISGNTIKDNVCVIYCLYSSNNIISGNLINDIIYQAGIIFVNSSSNVISGNDISKVAGGYCISLSNSSNTVIFGNNITDSSCGGIEVSGSSDNIISKNNITNVIGGIRLSYSSNNTISGNNITDNWGVLHPPYPPSIELSGSSNNTISGNNITDNYEGIRLYNCSNNSIYHNNFSNNTQQVFSYESTSVWHDGYPSGGNYWSDYTGVDKYSGPTQDELSSDGIGDTPYVIDENNTDNYPLMVPWGTLYGYYDWPMFHHDLHHTGYSTSTAPNTNSTIWSYTTGGGVYSSPAVADDRVYVGSSDSKVYCLDAATGAHIWNYKTGGPLKFSSPAVACGKVYVGSWDNKTYCLNATSGDHIWNYTTGDYVLSSPAVADGKVYVGSYDDNVYCLNATTGAKIWNYTTGSAVFSSPAVACGKVYVGSSDNKTYAFGLFHDVAVVNVTTSKCGCPGVGNGDPYPVLCQGRTAKVYVTVKNQGNIPETFDVTVYANDSIIQTYTVNNLAPGSQETRTVIWNATGWAKGNYTIKAVAEQLPGEIDVLDNTFIDGWIMVVHPGDLDNSGEVDITDVVMVTAIYRAKIGDPDYNACRDVVEDGEIDIADVVAVTAHYREKAP